MFANNPNWYYVPASTYIKYGFWTKIGGRTEKEIRENAKRIRNGN